MKLSELNGVVAGLGTQLAKVQQEILGRIADLEAALTDVEVPEAAVTALADLAVAVQGLDDMFAPVIMVSTPTPNRVRELPPEFDAKVDGNGFGDK